MTTASSLLSTRVVAAGGCESLLIDVAEVAVVVGPDRGLKVELGADSLIVGSASGCDLVLHDPTVSARHAEIGTTRNGYFVRDLDSKNGVRLGRYPVERAKLCDGMRLGLGQSSIEVRATGRHTTKALAPPSLTGSLIARSVAMRALLASLEPIAASDMPLLIEGETGSGKEAVAEWVHQTSNRRGGPFIVLDCGALPPALAAAELLGHERGAFTGAGCGRSGLLEEAEGGALFVDEIGELPLEVQPLLLRAIERRASRSIGGNADRRHDVRVIAATNRNLAEEMRANRFLAKLFYCLSTSRVRVPPLRDRPEDVPALADHFAAELGIVLPPEALVALQAYGWPGNVRELKNVVASLATVGLEGAARLVRSEAIVADQLLPLPEARRRASEDFERRYLEEALRRSGGSVSRAAQIAGVSRRVFTMLVGRHGLRIRDRKPGHV
ncbi:MAG: sigma 54-interacting transcriptional regulator [Pseudomonadota bacterium]